jgi:phage N-6-adenine-methyltransferase
MNEIESDIRSTPDDFFNYINNIFRFDTDVCANKDNKKCIHYFDFKQNGLKQDWGKCNWCNPPYSRGQIDKWLKKGIEEQKKGNTSIFLIPADTSTKWYQENIINSNAVVWAVPKRLKFEGISNGAKFASHLVIYFGAI